VKLYTLGKVPWHESQLIYHALATLGTEAVSLVSPATPYVCIGFHQDLEQEVDLEFCKANRIPVFRREVGGGATYLDGDQLFFQVILHRDNPEVPMRKETFYRKFLQPIINVYRRVGIPARYRPINDVVTDTRKISGTGVGEIGDCVVFVGNLILDFNYEMMSRVLKVPDEKFRDKVHKSLMENLSTIRRELGEKRAKEWDEVTLNTLMAEEFEKLLGPTQPSEKDKVLQAKIDELGELMMSDAWLYQKGKRISGRDVKIRAGMKVLQKLHKAKGGLIRADFELREGSFRNASISGDFFCFPEEAVSMLESRLEGQSTEEVRTILDRLYSEEGIETPGIEIDDWMRVLTR
jgi:lipoate-protein ligase A